MNKHRKSIVKAQRIDLGDDELDKNDVAISNNSDTKLSNYDQKNQKLQLNNSTATQITEKVVWTVSVSRPSFSVISPLVAATNQECKQIPKLPTSKPCNIITKPSCSSVSSIHYDAATNALLSPRLGLRNIRSLSSRENSLQSTIEDEEGLVRVNEYSVLEDLGWGSFGRVKLVEDQDGKKYALKIISKRKLMKSAGFFRRPPPLRNSSASIAGSQCHIASSSRNARSNSTSTSTSASRSLNNSPAHKPTNKDDSTKTPNKSPSIQQAQPHHSDPLHRVYQEIAIHKKLDHPNIVKLHQVIDETDAPNLYMIFEFIEGGPVMHVGQSEPISELVARNYFRDILLGLEYLHFNKIIHRDIKPSNLLIDKDGNVKMIDFGVSCQFTGEDIFLQDTLGSPAFLAPEVVKEYSTRFTGKALDIWALGITLYCFLFGRVAFDSHNKFDLYRMIASKPLSFPEEPIVSDEARDLLTKMLNKNPKQRIKLPQIMTHNWVTENGARPMNNLTVTNNQKNSNNNDLKSLIKLDQEIDQIKINNSSILKEQLVDYPIMKQIQVTDLEIAECTVKPLRIETIVTAYRIARRRSFRKSSTLIQCINDSPR